MRPTSQESFRDSSTCSFFRESSSSSTSSPRAGFVRLIPVKLGKPKLDKEKIQHHSKRKKELHRRLEWIENIFEDYPHERIMRDIGTDHRCGARPRSQPASPTGLPRWVLLSCPGGKHTPLGTSQKASRNACMQRSCSNQEIPDTMKQRSCSDPSRPRSHQSQRLSIRIDEAMMETSLHSQRSSASSCTTLTQRQRNDSTDEWRHHVLRQDFRNHASSFALKPSEEQDEQPISPSTKKGSPTGRNYWMMLFGARRLALKTEFKVNNGCADAAQISDSLNLLTETEVVDLVRWVSKKEMDVLKDLPVLVDAWRTGGYPYGVNPEWLTEIAEQENTRAFLDVDEFLSVWTGYFDKMTDFHNEVFMSAAMDSQVVAESELPLMFRDLGLWPMCGALAEACQRIVPLKRRGKVLTLTDFHKVYNDLYSRAGLTTKEHAKAEKLFKQQHVNKTQLDVEELYLLLKKIKSNFMLTSHEPPILTEGFMYALAKEVVIRVRERTISLNIDSWHHVFEHSSNRTPYHDGVMGTIDINDFFVACNIYHHHIAERVAKALERIGLSAAERMHEKDILNLFDELGHCSPCLNTFLEEALEDVDLLGRRDFTFGDVYSIVSSYWSVDSFSRAQREELAWLFNIFATSLPDVQKKDDMLCISELKRALRWMCFTPSQHRLFTFMDWCGRSIADYMDLDVFSSLVSDYRHSNIGMARATFRQLVENDDGHLCSIWKDAPVHEFGLLMSLVGHSLTDQELLGLTESANVINGNIAWREFLRLEELHRKNIKEDLKNNLGFTALEVESLARAFKANTVQGTEFINFQGFSKIFPKLIPRMPIDASVRKVLEESDMNSNHHVEFNEFLWIMRRLYDKDSKEESCRDQMAMDELGYTAIEVREMRVLFNMSDKDLSGSLDVSEVMKLFMGLVEMSHEAEHELQNYLDQVDKDVNGTLDFWEFLGLMRTLEKNNWRNILRVAAKQVSQLEEINQKQEAIAAAKQFSNLKTTGLSHMMMM